MYSSVITLANSIIGVSILAMPYCYKQCGIILATLMVILSGTIVKLACHLLIKSAIMARRRNIENLAFHTHGPVGKLLVELGIIGYLIGTSIAFFVVMGDLGPPLIAKLAGVEQSYNLRLVILTGLGLFVALPLSLLRNIESLQIICASSIMFYLVVVFRVVLEAAPQLTSTHWMEGVALWRPGGMLQCFPIFSMALACQANVFEVYTSMPDPSPQKMNLVVKGAVNLCSCLYIIIGFFGYLAFHAVDFGGNILTSFTTSTPFVDFLKLGFVISVAVSFPLVVFPCRTSIHSLIFRKTYQGIGSTELVADYIPPARFNLITLCVILITLGMGIVLPDIELVLGIVGSTMGSSICVIFPAVAFLKLTSKNTTERLAAQGVLIIGIITLILGTYVNLVEHTSAPQQEYEQGFGQPKPVYVPPPGGPPLPQVGGKPGEQAQNIIQNGEAVIKNIVDQQNVDKEEVNAKENVEGQGDDKKEEESAADKRQEPAVPEEPQAIPKPELNSVEKSANASDNKTKVTNKETKSDDTGTGNKNATNDKTKDGKSEKADTKNDKGDDKTELNAEKLLKEMAEYKKDQERVLIEQKKILSELKQHQQHEVAQEQNKANNSVPAVNQNQQIQNDGGQNQQIQNGGNQNQLIPNGGNQNQLIQNDGSQNQLFQNGGNQNQLIQNGGAAIAQPGVAIAQPGAAIAQPGAAIAQPGAAIAQPGAAIAQPGGQPVAYNAQPASSNSQPIVASINDPNNNGVPVNVAPAPAQPVVNQASQNIQQSAGSQVGQQQVLPLDQQQGQINQQPQLKPQIYAAANNQDQPFKNGIIPNQPIQINGNINQQIQNGENSNQQIQNGGNINQQVQYSGFPNQQIQNVVNSNQQIQNGKNPNQQIQNGINPNQQNQNGVNPNQQIQITGIQNQQIQNGGIQNQQVHQQQLKAAQPQNSYESQFQPALGIPQVNNQPVINTYQQNKQPQVDSYQQPVNNYQPINNLAAQAGLNTNNHLNVVQNNQQIQLQNFQGAGQNQLNQPNLANNQPQMAAYSAGNNINPGMVNNNHELPNSHVKRRNKSNLLPAQNQNMNNQQGPVQFPPQFSQNNNNLNNYKNNNISPINNDFLKADDPLNKAERDRRDALCQNDPNCGAKFDRNPLEDSPLNNDLLRLQYIGGKRNLQEERSISLIGNNSVKDDYRV